MRSVGNPSNYAHRLAFGELGHLVTSCPRGFQKRDTLLNWYTAYAVVGLAAVAAASVLSDRFRTKAAVAALVSGLLWPIVVIGAAQLALWTAFVNVARKTPAAVDLPARMRPRVDVPPV